jgi:hypothetical protein
VWVRHRVLAGVAAVLLLGCAGTPPAPTPEPVVDDSFPGDLPSFELLSDAPDATEESGPTASPLHDVTLGCNVDPPVVVAGQRYIVSVIEYGPWYGKDRYYQVTGLPIEPFVELQLADGGAGKRTLIDRVGPGDVGSGYSIGVLMRDWDIHGIRPGTGILQTHRPEGTNHEATCAVELTIVPIP